jgi:hypothetical protein
MIFGRPTRGCGALVAAGEKTPRAPLSDQAIIRDEGATDAPTTGARAPHAAQAPAPDRSGRHPGQPGQGGAPPRSPSLWLKTNGSGYGKLRRGNGGGKPTFCDGQRAESVNRSDGYGHRPKPVRPGRQGTMPMRQLRHDRRVRGIAALASRIIISRSVHNQIAERRRRAALALRPE